ncbi:MAG: hypothetical protein WBE26_18615 [Phycisphaerae bacterium]
MTSWIRWVRTGAVVLLSVGGIMVLLIWLARAGDFVGVAGRVETEWEYGYGVGVQ